MIDITSTVCCMHPKYLMERINNTTKLRIVIIYVRTYRTSWNNNSNIILEYYILVS